MKRQIHVSGMLQMEACGEAFYRRNILGERTGSNTFLIVGGAVDDSVNADMTEKRDTQELLPVEQVRDIARDGVHGRWENEGVILAAEEALDGEKKTKGAATDKAVRLAGLHRKALAPLLVPTQVQQRFCLDVDGYDFQLAGTIDIREGIASIRDTKTAAKSPQDNAAETSLQLTAYALAVKATEGEIPISGYLDTLVDKKFPEVVLRSRKFHERDFDPFLARLQNAAEAIKKGVFIPARPDGPSGWICSAKFCPFWSDCLYALRPVSVSVPLVNIQPTTRGKDL